MMDYDVRVELVEQACALTPGLESPTVSPLHDKGYVAVRAMVPRSSTNQVMDELYDLGARAADETPRTGQTHDDRRLTNGTSDPAGRNVGDKDGAGGGWHW